MDKQQERPMSREAQRAATADTSITQAKRVIDLIEVKLKEGYRVPMKRDLSIVNASELIDLIGQLRIALPKAVVQAQEVLQRGEEILNQGKQEADKMADAAEKIYKETVSKAAEYERKMHEDADRYSEQVRQKALDDANAQIEDAQARAEQIILAAQQQAQQLVSDSEVTRRAQAYAMETRERAQHDADSIYTQACVQVDKMLSGASVALSRSAGEMAALRDSLLGRGNAGVQGQGGAQQGMQSVPPIYEQR